MPAMVTRTVIAFATMGDTPQIKIIFMCVAPPEEGNYSLCQHCKHLVIKFANGNTDLQHFKLLPVILIEGEGSVQLTPSLK